MNDDLRRMFGRLANLRAMADSERDADRREYLLRDIRQCKSTIIKELNKAYPGDEKGLVS